MFFELIENVQTIYCCSFSCTYCKILFFAFALGNIFSINSNKLKRKHTQLHVITQKLLSSRGFLSIRIFISTHPCCNSNANPKSSSNLAFNPSSYHNNKNINLPLNSSGSTAVDEDFWEASGKRSGSKFCSDCSSLRSTL